MGIISGPGRVDHSRCLHFVAVVVATTALLPPSPGVLGGWMRAPEGESQRQRKRESTHTQIPTRTRMHTHTHARVHVFVRMCSYTCVRMFILCPFTLVVVCLYPGLCNNPSGLSLPSAFSGTTLHDGTPLSLPLALPDSDHTQAVRAASHTTPHVER